MLMRLLALILFLALASPSWAQMAAVSSHATSRTNLFAGTSTYNYTFGGNTIASGNLVVIFAETEIRTVTGISGTNLASMTQLGSTQINAADFRGTLWYGISTGSVTGVTVTASGATNDPACVAYVELSGEAADQSGATSNGSANNNVTTHNSGSVTPATANNTVVMGTARTSATWTEDGAFTLVGGANAECALAYLTQTAATAQEFNGTSDINRYSVMNIGALSGASGGGTPATNFFRLRVNP